MTATSHQAETLNLPSASSFARYAACPGSFLMERDQPEEESEDAARGTLIHAILSGEHKRPVTDLDVLDAVEICRALEATLLANWDAPCAAIQRECRLWIRNLQTLERLYSGKADGIVVEGDRALVWDFKTGRVPVTSAEANWQLRTLAVLVAENFGVNEVTVAILQPWAGPRITQAIYDREALAQADIACGVVATRVVQPGQPRHASPENCRYCRAKGVCPEAAAMIPSLGAMTLREEDGELTNDALLRLLNVCGHVERVIGAIRARAKGILTKDPHALPGWTLHVSKPRESVEDTLKVFDACVVRGVDPRSFVAECKIAKKDLSALLRAATGTRGKELEGVIERATDGALKYGNATVSLERTQAAIPETLSPAPSNLAGMEVQT